ncbi:hypothetical protein V5H41_29035, partial [Salmonella enterica]
TGRKNMTSAVPEPAGGGGEYPLQDGFWLDQRREHTYDREKKNWSKKYDVSSTGTGRWRRRISPSGRLLAGPTA